MRKMVWLMILVGLVVFAAGVVITGERDEVKKTDIPLYDGKPGEKIGDVRINPTDGAEMLWVPAGEFLMGYTDEEIAQIIKENPKLKAEWFADQKPQRKVHLDGYWIYKNEVSVAQYRKFCKATSISMPKDPPWGWKDNHPMVNVNWDDAVAYAKWAGVSLPTEAQWEKAARGTDGRRFPWGSEWPPKKLVGNFGDKSLAKENPKLAKMLADNGLPVLNDYDDGYGYTSPVGSYVAGKSPYGCLDMAGNVWEWCADWYSENYYETAPLKNPTGPLSGGARVLRGGSWYYGFNYFQCAYRDDSGPAYRCYYNGFRCARTP